MRKSDKLKNFKKANLLAENRYLESKGFEVELYNEIDEPPMGVNQINEPTNNDSVDFNENIGKPLRKFLSQFLFQGNDGYLSRELINSKRLSQEEMNGRIDKVIKELVTFLNFGKKEISKLDEEEEIGDDFFSTYNTSVSRTKTNLLEYDSTL